MGHVWYSLVSHSPKMLFFLPTENGQVCEIHWDSSVEMVDESSWMGLTLQQQPQISSPCWNIYLQNWAMFGVNVGKYSSTMVRIWETYVLWSGFPRQICWIYWIRWRGTCLKRRFCGVLWCFVVINWVSLKWSQGLRGAKAVLYLF